MVDDELLERDRRAAREVAHLRGDTVLFSPAHQFVRSEQCLGELCCLAQQPPNGRPERICCSSRWRRSLWFWPKAEQHGVGEYVRFDWHDPATYERAVEGIDRMYLVPPPLDADSVPLKRGPTPCGQPAGTGDAQPADRQQPPQTPERAPRRQVRRLIALSVAEIRHLFNLIGKDDHAVKLGLYWSNLHRSHQAEARRHHFKRHLRLQIIQI
ncbi:hypothetical protein ABZ801_34665 [Actinomadura sp. NPDC047616]|uniref:hypothetical protein n=1 Tax=Actinomadura sp. NPDC047616 TaxID=3155914 RepID=UPI0033F88D8E